MTELLERDESLASLAASLAAGGRLVFVGGEAGVGKTALVRAFATSVSTPVLNGSCESLATPIPLGPFVDLAAATDGRLADAVAAQLDPRAVARALLAELNEPAVVVLEDVHWADEATLDALRVLGRRVHESAGRTGSPSHTDCSSPACPKRPLTRGRLAGAPMRAPALLRSSATRGRCSRPSASSSGSVPARRRRLSARGSGRSAHPSRAARVQPPARIPPS